MDGLRSDDSVSRLVFLTADSHQFMFIGNAPIDMAAQGERRKRAGRRVPGKNRPDLNLETLTGLLENQTTAGQNRIVKVGGKIDPAHNF